MERRLATILAADVVGYTRLMGADEAGTLERLKALRKELVQPKITERKGRIVKLLGDGLLAEFSSVVEAVQCAIDIQKELTEREHSVAEDLRIRLRIGINLGDIILEGLSDIYGDGVNVAARLESLAYPEGICVSGDVFRYVKGKVKAEFEDLGEKELKNVSEPVRVYRITAFGVDLPSGQSKTEALPLPDKPSIAVLPFDNMSGDQEQEYFSDGLAEDIITALSHFRELLVVARNTSFSFKGKSATIDQISKKLNVRYVLEGSVRKAGNRVRVTAQLIDGRSNEHIWAERFDRDLDDLFKVQDEITNSIVTAVAPKTLRAEVSRAQAKTVDDLSARERVMRARWHINKLTKADNKMAYRYLDEAISASPELADAHSTMAECLLNDVLHLWRDDTDVAISEALAAARRAVSLDPEDANGLAVLGTILLFARRFDDARDYLERSVRLNPNLANAYGLMAAWYGCCGEYEKSCEAADKALEISPLDSSRPLWLAGRGIAAYVHGDYERVIDTCHRLLRDHPGFASALRQLAASFAMLGRDEEAKEATKTLLERMPGLTVSKVHHIVPIRDREAHERWLEGLRKAGLPE